MQGRENAEQQMETHPNVSLLKDATTHTKEAPPVKRICSSEENSTVEKWCTGKGAETLTNFFG